MLPKNASITFPDDKSAPSTFQELQSLGALRPDIYLGIEDRSKFPFMWLLTHDSKASPFTRLLFRDEAVSGVAPTATGRLRVWEIASPEGASRAWALQLLVDTEISGSTRETKCPAWISTTLPALGRFWGDGVTKIAPLAVNTPIFDWAQ